MRFNHEYGVKGVQNHNYKAIIEIEHEICCNHAPTAQCEKNDVGNDELFLVSEFYLENIIE